MTTSFLADASRGERAGRPQRRALAWAVRATGWLAAMLEVRRQRRQLASLDDALLKDLGLSSADVARETGRPFWDLPRLG